ncbi:MAG: Bacterial non-heme ferritin [Candidatus Thorarchaeota archaeon]|nr:MAG: Bacterial non-heme ferritin [Candidatus Thorarchaeota archaeon]
MEISKELADMINDQLNFEIYSGYIYLAMAAWFEDQNLAGIAHWMEIQFDEEYAHAMRFWRHLYERGAKVELKAIEGPKTEWASPLEAFEDAYEHEKLVTQRIYKIGELAEEQKDRATLSFLNWFYDEQVEEEDKTMEIRDLLKMIGDSIPALLQLDAKLGARGEAPPVPQESTGP